MIRVICPKCGSKLNAKEELAGQTRKCPKCREPVLIAPAEPEAEAPAASPAEAPAVAEPEAIEDKHLPQRLNRQHRYVICDKAHLFATWESGTGWMLRTTAGAISAVRNSDQLPKQGVFVLVELKTDMTDEGLRLTGLTAYQLDFNWALTCLARGDDLIMGKITDLGSLNRDQKNAVRQAIREQFMADVWSRSTDVQEFLSNTDYHSSGVG